MKAYVNGTEVTITEFYNDNGIPFCKVRILDCDWVIKVPTAFIDIR